MDWEYGSPSDSSDGYDREPRDYSGSKDYSTLEDQSRPNTRAQEANETASSLGRDEMGAVNPISGAKETKSQQRDIPSLESSGTKLYNEGSRTTQLYDSKSSRGRGNAGGKTGFMKKARNKIVLGIVTAIIAGVGWLFGPAILGTTGILQFSEMLSKHFNVNIESISTRRVNKMFYKRVQESNRTPGVKGLCTKKVKVACRYSGMSNRAIRNLERRVPGLTVNKSRIPHLPGRSGMVSITLPSGETLSAGQFSDRLKAGDPHLQRYMREAMKPKVAVWANAKVQALFRKLGIDKLGGFIREKTVGKAKAKLKERQRGNKVNLDSVKANDNTGDSTKNLDAEQKNARAKSMFDGLIGDNNEINQKMSAAPEAKVNTAKALTGSTKGVAQGIGRAVAITGTIDLACTILNIISAIGYIAKLIGTEQLMSYTATFKSSVDGMKAGEGTPAGWEVLGNMLFTEDPNTGQTAFQSFGYGMISGDFWGDPEDTMEFKTGGGLVGGMMDVRNEVLKLIPGGSSAARQVCGFIQNVFVRIGSAIIGIVAAIASGGATLSQIIPQGLLWGALFAGVSFMVPVVARMLAGEFVGPDTIGGSAGNALTSGAGALAAQNCNAQGCHTMTKDEALGFDQNVRQPYLAMIQEDERLAADPWDFTNPYSITGSITGKFLPYVAHGSWTSTLANLSALVVNPFSVFSPNVSAYSTLDYYNVCQDEEYQELAIAVDPFCNPVYGMDTGLLEMDPDTVVEEMYKDGNDDGHIDENGAPKSKAYKNFIADCIENTGPIAPHQDEESKPYTRGPQCVRGSAEFKKAGFEDLFYIFTLDDSVNQMMECVLDEIAESCYGGQSGGSNDEADSSSGGSSTSGDGNIVAAATGGFDKLNCADCVRFVNSVYAKAGKQKPFVGNEDGCKNVGNAGQVNGYFYCKGFSVTDKPIPGDVVVWKGHVAIYLGNGKVAEGGGPPRTNIPEACNINKAPWRDRSLTDPNVVKFLHYKGG